MLGEAISHPRSRSEKSSYFHRTICTPIFSPPPPPRTLNRRSACFAAYMSAVSKLIQSIGAASLDCQSNQKLSSRLGEVIVILCILEFDNTRDVSDCTCA
ncbi:hypothetical protein Droror1_Dr00025563 [Drosera rotundifolia]